MDISVINQFEKILRNSFIPWRYARIDRDDTDRFTSFNIRNDEDITIYCAWIRQAINVVDSFTIAFDTADVCMVIDMAEYDSKKVPVIKILISRK